jgi:hypothetical protein
MIGRCQRGHLVSVDRIVIEKPPGLLVYLVGTVLRPPFFISTELDEGAPWSSLVDLSKSSENLR